jgi:hypothetical protein
MSDHLTLDDFLPHVGQDLAIDVPGVGETAAMTLQSATPARCASPAGVRSGFSLLLRAPASVGIAQGIYAVQHPRLGRLEIFMVPVGADERTVQYEAVFN